MLGLLTVVNFTFLLSWTTFLMGDCRTNRKEAQTIFFFAKSIYFLQRSLYRSCVFIILNSWNFQNQKWTLRGGRRSFGVIFLFYQCLNSKLTLLISNFALNQTFFHFWGTECQILKLSDHYSDVVQVPEIRFAATD